MVDMYKTENNLNIDVLNEIADYKQFNFGQEVPDQIINLNNLLGKNVKYLSRFHNIPSLTFEQFVSDEFQRHFEKQQGLLVLFNTGAECENVPKCAEILSQVSNIYASYAGTNASNSSENNLKIKYGRLPVETINVHIPTESIYSSKKFKFIGSTANLKYNVWEK